MINGGVKVLLKMEQCNKGSSSIKGQYQPQLPDELGFYDLSNTNIFYKQIELAKKYGVYGFCFHYYWFSGKRLVEKPIFNYLNDKNLDFPFMLCGQTTHGHVDGMDLKMKF